MKGTVHKKQMFRFQKTILEKKNRNCQHGEKILQNFFYNYR